MKANK